MTELRNGSLLTAPQANRNRCRGLLRFSFLAVCFAAFVVPEARGQQLQPVQTLPAASAVTLDAVATKLADAIASSKEGPVIVLDFVGPNEIAGTSEKQLANDFSSALSRSGNRFVVLGRAQIPGALQKRKLTASDLEDSVNAMALAKELKAKVYVWGAFTLGPSDINLSVEAFRVPDQKPIGGYNARLALTAELKELSDKRIAQGLAFGFPSSGENGYTTAKCIQCRQALYDPRAVSHRSQGTAILSIVVTLEGRADDIVVLRTLPWGLTEQAVEAVKGWRFQPAADAEGKPAAVRQKVEVSFHLDAGN
jgi:TonB family protein